MASNRLEVSAMIRIGPLMLLAGFLAAGILAPFAALAGDVTIENGVTLVRNGAEPDHGVRTLKLEEIWRAGDEDDDMLFGLLTSVQCDRDGNVYLLDAQLCQVHVYSPDGEHLRTLFRQGEGPGEVTSARDMALFDDGRVGVIQEFPGKMVMVDREGLPAGVCQPGGDDPSRGGGVSLTSCAAGHGLILMTGTAFPQRDDPAIQKRVNFLASFSPDGKELARFAQNETAYNFQDFVFAEREHMPNFWWGAAVGPDGNVYAAPQRHPYAIFVWRPDGTLIRTIERAYEPYRRSADDVARLRSTIDSAMNSLPIPYRIEVEDLEPDIQVLQRGIRLQPDGSLWVLSSRGAYANPPGIMATFDVFDADGQFTRQIRLEGPDSAFRDGIFFPRPDRVVVVKGFVDALAAQFGRGSTQSDESGADEATMQVIGYRVVE